MAQQTNKTGIIIVVIILLVGFAILAWKKGWFSTLGTSRQAKTAGVEGDGISCTGARLSSASAKESLCTKPLYQVVPNKVRELCWTEDQLGFVPDAGTDITHRPYDDFKWYYNRQDGDKYCFVNAKDYPLFVCDSNNPGYDKDGNQNPNC